MSFLNQALQLAEKGFYVFPLQMGGKKPVIDDFPNRATRDPEQIRKFWTDPVLGNEKPYNVGISTSKYNGSQALVVVDVDNKGKKKGLDQVIKLELEGYEFLDTATQKTPTGGKHFIYRTKIPVKQGESVLGPGVDIRSKGGYIVAPGSVIDGISYEWETPTEVAECPQWIIEKCGKVLEKEKRVAGKDIDHERALARARFYLEGEAPVAVEGSGGDQTTFKVAAKLKDLGVPESDATELLLEDWNSRCVPPWDVTELTKKVSNAYNYGAKALGSDAPEMQFDPVGANSPNNYLEEMNKTFAIVFGGADGGHTILHETTNIHGKASVQFMKEVTFKRLFSPKTVQVGRSTKSYAEQWLDWSGRREYRGIVFMPEAQAPKGYYNLWRGFTCKPKPYGEASAAARSGFDAFISHVKENICSGDESHFMWVMGYFAHLIQKPFERPLTTLVFKGRKGTGKNAFVDRIGKILGDDYFKTAHNGRYLTSNFNGHLESCLCLVLDEAFWSGDKSAEGQLKGITTAETILIERKGMEPYSVKNLVRVVIIGNEEWLVPASADERRYAVFNVGEKRIRDNKFFEAMRINMDLNGGNEILLHYLKSFDLSAVSINVAPMTEGLQEQKINSLDPFHEFIFSCLLKGKIGDIELGNDIARVSKKYFRDQYISFKKDKNAHRWNESDMLVGKLLSKIFKNSVRLDQRLKVSEGREWCYEMDKLETLRNVWDEFVGFKTNWPQDL